MFKHLKKYLAKLTLVLSGCRFFYALNLVCDYDGILLLLLLKPDTNVNIKNLSDILGWHWNIHSLLVSRIVEKHGKPSTGQVFHLMWYQLWWPNNKSRAPWCPVHVVVQIAHDSLDFMCELHLHSDLRGRCWVKRHQFIQNVRRISVYSSLKCSC